MAEFPAYDQDLKCLPKFFFKVEAPPKGFWRDFLPTVWKFLQLLYSGPGLECVKKQTRGDGLLNLLLIYDITFLYSTGIEYLCLTGKSGHDTFIVSLKAK